MKKILFLFLILVFIIGCSQQKTINISEEEINTKMDSLADEYMQTQIPNAKVGNFENLSIAFTYRQTVKLVKLSENLVRSTDKLKCWTRAIAVLTLLLFCTTIFNIVVYLRCN